MSIKAFSESVTSKNYVDIPKISVKDEDWKYTKIIDEINDFEPIKNFVDLKATDEFEIITNGAEYLAKESNYFQTEDIRLLGSQLVSEYYKRPFDRFIAQQYQKCSGGFLLSLIKNNEETIKIDVHSNGLIVPYIGISCEKNVTSKILINFGENLQGSAYPIIEIFGHENSSLEVIINTSSVHDIEIINSIYAELSKDSSLSIHTVSTGGRFSRNRIDVDLKGDGSNFLIDGVYFGENSQIHDNRVFVNHIAKRTTSNMLTKGVLGDSSKSVFTGTIHIAEGAEKTESHQENRNILLSDTASAQSVPNLEILCDDVICGHGSSVGPLDEKLFHYVMSRGIEREGAEKLLINGFFNEVLKQNGWEEISETVAKTILEKYEKVRKGKN